MIDMRVENNVVYFNFLEDLRKSGVTNMYGAVPYLMSAFRELSREDAKDILAYWMLNYNLLKKSFDW